MSDRTQKQATAKAEQPGQLSALIPARNDSQWRKVYLAVVCVEAGLSQIQSHITKFLYALSLQLPQSH